VNCGASVAESSLLLSIISLVMITPPPIATMSPQGKRSAGVPMADPSSGQGLPKLGEPQGRRS
jgi:hypothetical protein